MLSMIKEIRSGKYITQLSRERQYQVFVANFFLPLDKLKFRLDNISITELFENLKYLESL